MGIAGWIRVGAIVLPLLFVLGGVLHVLSTRRRRRNWVSVRGRGTGDAGKGVAGWAPRISFVTRDGAEITGTPLSFSDVGLSNVRPDVPVWYDPADPRRFLAEMRWSDRPGRMWFLAAAVTAVIGFGATRVVVI